MRDLPIALRLKAGFRATVDTFRARVGWIQNVGIGMLGGVVRGRDGSFSAVCADGEGARRGLQMEW